MFMKKNFKYKQMFDFSNYAKESNTAKRVNIATEFNEFKDALLNKKNYQAQNEKNSE